MSNLFKRDIHLLRSIIINAITATVGTGFALNRKRNPELRPVRWPEGSAPPLVDIIIPARDEERNIRPLLDTLVAQDYPRESYRINVVDDGSTDGTAEIVREYEAVHKQVRLVQALPLGDGWTGKNNAMYTGYVNAAREVYYLLFVDADTRHHPLMLATVVTRAEEAGVSLLSLIIKVEMETFWERLMVPQVGELYTLLVGTMDTVNRNKGEEGAAANGQFILIRPAAYAQALAQPEVRRDVAEDRAIAAALKGSGKAVRLEYGRRLVSARVYASLSEMWAGYSKTIFWASGHNVARTLLVVTALTMYGFMPLLSPLFAFLRGSKQARLSAARHVPVQWIPMLLLRAVVCRSMGVSAIYAAAYPLAVAVGNAMVLFSLYRVVSGKGVVWKGRTYR